MIVRRGLDIRNNPIDALVDRFGFSCVTEPGLDLRPCTIESKLLSFLHELAPDQDSIARDLSVLGARCRKEDTRLDCLYERQVHSAGWAWGYDRPMGTADELFRITFTVDRKGDAMNYSVDFERILEPR